MGIAICPRGAPFQATVNPEGKEMTASKGPAFVIDPTNPVVKAVRITSDKRRLVSNSHRASQ